MKIAINNVCNSKCPYCFAGNMGIDKTSNMPFETFKNLLNWGVREGDQYVQILGGEPTIHPDFDKFLNEANKLGFNIQLLTNGVELEKYLEVINVYKTTYLININSKLLIGNKGYDKLINSLDKLISKYNESNIDLYNAIILGCNLHYEANHDYDFFWNIVDKFNLHVLRVSVASPQNNKFLYDRDTYFKYMKEEFITFVKKAKDRGCFICFDCSQIPECYFTKEDFLNMNIYDSSDLYNYACKPLLTILPDLTMSCCFGNKDFEASKQKFDFKLTKSDFDSLLKIISDQHNKPDNYIYKCLDCKIRDKTHCLAGCKGFRDGKSLDELERGNND